MNGFFAVERVRPAMAATARVVLSFPDDLSGWGRRQLETPWVRAYLRKTLGDVREGDITEEFLDVGCCGSTLDVSLRVERLEGTGAVTSATAVEYVPRKEAGADGAQPDCRG